MTRRILLLLGLTSAALLASWRASRADEPPKDKSVGKGLIYAYAWGKGGVEMDQAIFALDPARMTWTEVAGQSDSKVYDTHFRISRDGRLLAFERWGREGEKSRAVGVSIRDLARDGEIRKPPGPAGTPIWHPDGKRLLVNTYTGDVPGTQMPKHEAWIMGADGSDPKKLPIPDTEQVDDISPDGSWVLTCSHRDKGVGYQTYRMKPDGTEARRLTTTGKGVLNLDGRISPDGRQVAYWRVGDDQSGIWVMDADGANPRRIFEATKAEEPGVPAWSPDGRKIAISTHAWRRHKEGYDEKFNHQIIILDLAGAAPLRVNPPLPDGLSNPQWAPPWKP